MINENKGFPGILSSRVLKVTVPSTLKHNAQNIYHYHMDSTLLGALPNKEHF